jgi:hypothetical protein
MKLLKRLKAPLWIVWNLLKACWFRELIYMAERKKQKPVRRAMLLALIDIEIVATYLVYAVCVVILGHLAVWVGAVVLAVHAASIEIGRAHMR